MGGEHGTPGYATVMYDSQSESFLSKVHFSIYFHF